MLKHERTLIPSQVLDAAVDYFSVTNGLAYFGSVAATIKEVKEALKIKEED